MARLTKLTEADVIDFIDNSGDIVCDNLEERGLLLDCLAERGYVIGFEDGDSSYDDFLHIFLAEEHIHCSDYEFYSRAMKASVALSALGAEDNDIKNALSAGELYGW